MLSFSIETTVPALARHAWHARGLGDFWAHMLVAEGAVDGAVDAVGLSEWDLAAVQVIVEEAGGRFSDCAGEVAHRLGQRGHVERAPARRAAGRDRGSVEARTGRRSHSRRGPRRALLAWERLDLREAQFGQLPDDAAISRSGRREPGSSGVGVDILALFLGIAVGILTSSQSCS